MDLCTGQVPAICRSNECSNSKALNTCAVPSKKEIVHSSVIVYRLVITYYAYSKYLNGKNVFVESN